MQTAILSGAPSNWSTLTWQPTSAIKAIGALERRALVEFRAVVVVWTEKGERREGHQMQWRRTPSKPQ